LSASPPRWTIEQLDALAPDASSIKAAQKLKLPAKWPLLGSSARALWGECKGSGKKPYQATIDFSGPAWKCSCPSRKFPCKHALALAYLHVEQTSSFKTNGEPDWASEWLDKRAARAADASTPTDNEAPIDPVALEKKEAQRQKRIADRERRVECAVVSLNWLRIRMNGSASRSAWLMHRQAA